MHLLCQIGREFDTADGEHLLEVGCKLLYTEYGSQTRASSHFTSQPHQPK